MDTGAVGTRAAIEGNTRVRLLRKLLVRRRPAFGVGAFYRDCVGGDHSRRVGQGLSVQFRASIRRAPALRVTDENVADCQVGLSSDDNRRGASIDYTSRKSRPEPARRLPPARSAIQIQQTLFDGFQTRNNVWPPKRRSGPRSRLAQHRAEHAVRRAPAPTWTSFATADRGADRTEPGVPGRAGARGALALRSRRGNAHRRCPGRCQPLDRRGAA